MLRQLRVPGPLGRSGKPLQHVTIQPDAAAGSDGQIYSSAADSNYGAVGWFNVGDVSSSTSLAMRSLLKFPLTAIPAGSVITSVAVMLYEYQAAYANGPTTANVGLHRLLKAWTEAGATWNRYDGANAWGTAGVGLDGVDAVAAPSAVKTLDGTAEGGFVTWSGHGLLEDVQRWLDGSANNGWLVRSDAELLGTTQQAQHVFYSSDDGTAARRPKLVVGFYR